jgi:diguanylate cyclase
MLDALTQVHSRYAYEQRIEEECQRAIRHKQKLAYVLWDLDGFKGINDTFGHAAGDRLLRAVGTMFMESKRSEDFFARVGGEEFALLLPMTDAAAALTIANRLREQLAATQFHHSGKPTRVTISCGVTQFIEGDTAESIYERADRGVYLAKEQGRNRCIAI